MAGWELVGYTTATEVASGNLTLGTTMNGRAIATGQLAIACIAYRSNAAFTLPAGWTLIEQENSGNTTVATTASIASGLMAYCIWNTGTPPGLTFTRTGGDVARGNIVFYSGNHATPFDVSESVTLATASTLGTLPAITTSQADELIVLLSINADNINTNYAYMESDTATRSYNVWGFASPTLSWKNFIKRFDSLTTTGADVGFAVLEMVKTSAGSTGDFRFSTGNFRNVFIAAAFKRVAPTALMEVAKLARFDVLTPSRSGIAVERFSRYDILQASGLPSPQPRRQQSFTRYHPTPPVAPSAFTIGQWSVADYEDDGEVRVTVTELPYPGRSVITDIEYRVDGGTWTSADLAVPGIFNIDGLTNAVEVDIEIRAINAVGASATSDVKAVTPTDGKHRYWRIHVTANQSGNITAFNEIEMYEEQFGINVIAGGTVSADTTFDANHPASDAVDYSLAETGTATTHSVWASTNTAMPHWLKYDFGVGVTRNIKSIGIHNRTTASLAQSPGTFTIQWSDDNSAWTTKWTETAIVWTILDYRRFSDPTYDAPTYALSPHGSHAYWRFVGRSGQAITTIALAEMEMRATPSGADQCSGGTATASTTLSTNVASNAFDNNNATYWAHNSATEANYAWLKYAFAAPVEVAEIKIRARADAATSAPTYFSIQYSDDDTVWTTAWNVEASTGWVVSEERLFTDPNYPIEPITDITLSSETVPEGETLVGTLDTVGGASVTFSLV